MESIGYENLFSHKINHVTFLMKLNEFDLSKTDLNQEKSLLDILNSLNDWLIEHILNSDKLIAKLN